MQPGLPHVPAGGLLAGAGQLGDLPERQILLGAQMEDVLRMVVIEAMRPALIGVAIGAAGSLALGQALSKLVYGVRPGDPMTFAAVSVLLLAVALAAAAAPAWRASRVDPVQALREE